MQPSQPSWQRHLPPWGIVRTGSLRVAGLCDMVWVLVVGLEACACFSGLVLALNLEL